MGAAHGSHVLVTHRYRVVNEISQISVVNKYSKHLTRARREKCISLLMLPPVFFSTISRTEKQSGREKRTLSISQIETVDKKANHEFPDKIVFFFGGWVGGREGCFAHKSVYWLDFEILVPFAISNLTIAIKFLTERKRLIIKFSFKIHNIFWLAFICVFLCHRERPTYN